MRLMPALLQRNPHFRRLWLASAVSACGDYVFLGALGVWVALLTDSPATVGLVLAAEIAGTLAFGAIAGVLVDRWPKRRVMIAMDLARAAVLLPLLLVRHAGDFPLLMIVAFVLSGLSRFFSPAKAAMVKAVVPSEDLAAANGLQQMAFNLALLVGPVIGAWLVAAFGAAPILLADAFSFLISAWCLIPLPFLPVCAKAERVTFWRQLWTGIAVIRNTRSLAFLFIIIVMISGASSALNALDTFFVMRCLHLPARYVGIFGSIFIVGLFCGSALAVNRVLARLGLPRLLTLGILTMGSFFAGYALAPNYLLALPFMIGAGIGNGLANAAAPTIFILATPQEDVGKVVGLIETAGAVFALLGTALAGVCAEWWGIRPILCAAGLAILVTGLLALRAAGKDNLSQTANVSIGQPG